mmetsp:Transcript_20795/g.31070  ORF Transcript_20795/g.31070 Transcript_20795/m.31070 type:complete len:377 (-) Transcript_20795:135-1265(-)|eukprot:CAMPEP_0167750810 /NCGR_PEP_ID=MMETSP0110_2-20121227/6199_1 /TAXON_ID=629695 /ORGANISM="Gymnochlora sp., Strain CCMP2014" /LENGTH=376 /DNA_ID=CAMNT_0007636175 /DNA_START=141 /DNA_END=1271 /DNA_ORIENTATION=+
MPSKKELEVMEMKSVRVQSENTASDIGEEKKVPQKAAKPKPKGCMYMIKSVLNAFTIEREALIELLNVFLLVLTLILSFAIGLQFNFDYDTFRAADARYLAARTSLSSAQIDTRLDEIYDSLVDRDFDDNCSFLNRPLYAGGGSSADGGDTNHGDNYGNWNDEIFCGGRTNGVEDYLGDQLPSFKVYNASVWAVMLLGGCIIMGISVYVSLIICKPLRDVERFRCFVLLILPILTLIIVGGCIGIIAFFVLAVAATRIVYPLGAAGIFGEGILKDVMTWTLIVPTIVLLAALVPLVTYLVKRPDEEEEDEEDVVFKTQLSPATTFLLKEASLTNEKRLKSLCSKDPSFAYDVFGDAGIEDPGERLELINTFATADL